jgi:hypothetical protein
LANEKIKCNILPEEWTQKTEDWCGNAFSYLKDVSIDRFLAYLLISKKLWPGNFKEKRTKALRIEQDLDWKR